MGVWKALKRLVKKILGRPIDDREITMVEWLRQCGAVIGDDVDLIEFRCNPKDAPFLQIGNHVTCSYVQVLTHDASLRKFVGQNCNKIGRVVIGDYVFIGVNTVILPNVHIGSHVIVGAGSVVTKDIPDNSVAVGNPARVVGTCSDYIARHRERMKDERLVYWDVSRADMSPEERRRFCEDIDGKIVYMCSHSEPPVELPPL